MSVSDFTPIEYEYGTTCFDRKSNLWQPLMRQAKTTYLDHFCHKWCDADSEEATEALEDGTRIIDAHTDSGFFILAEVSPEAVAAKIRSTMMRHHEALAVCDYLNRSCLKPQAVPQRRCCPNCWAFDVVIIRKKVRCRCGWRGRIQRLHRRPAQ